MEAMEPGSNTIGFVTLYEYRQQYGGSRDEYTTCETPRHRGRSIEAVVVIALLEWGEEPLIWSACKDCFAKLDNEIDGEWHLRRIR